jgi:hypothetical protein
MSIAGEWRLRLDPSDTGVDSGWFKGELPERIQLPGSTDEQRFGKRNAAREPRRFTRSYEYVGPAWYQREIDIPEAWKGKRISLSLERCHWETQAWLDDRPLGLQNSLSSPHHYDFHEGVSPGKHRLTIRVDNRMRIDVGWWASAVTEEGPGNWNGIAGSMELRARDPIWIGSLRVFADAARKSAKVKLEVRNATAAAHDAVLLLRTGSAETKARIAISDRPETAVEADVPVVGNATAWSEFSPSVYELRAQITGGSFSDEAVTQFGFRDLRTSGRELQLNGRRLSLRGTVDNGAFPKHGYPPTDIETWRDRLRTYQQYGFNHVRFHSWCPPDAAFTAADQLGLMLQVENPMWIGDGRISANALRTAFIRQEAEAIVDTYGNHPSFLLMSMGNELGSGLDMFLSELVMALRERDPRHLYTSTSAPDNVRRPDDYFVTAGPRWQNLRGDPRLERNRPNTDFDYGEYVAPLDRPAIAHELGQWTVFPDLKEAEKYHGPLQPRYFDLYRESLERNGLLNQVEQFRTASGALMVALYKEEIESILRTRGVSGFQLLGLQDWPGFGPAFIGMVDAMNDPKGLIEPAAFRRFNSPTVPLLRMAKRAWTSAETLVGVLEVSHFGRDSIQAAPAWAVRDVKASTVASGKMPSVNVAPGGLMALGSLRVPLKELPAPARYSLEISLGGTSNEWNFWVYPESVAGSADDLVLAHVWNESTREALRNGRTVVLLATPEAKAKTVPTSFTTAFWSLLWFPKRPETMGILCDPAHPALAEFPTEFHSDWQWWELMSGSRAFVLNDAPAGLRPIVQVIDDANRNYRLGAVIEARVEQGKLLAVSLDLESDPSKRVVARQLKHSLLKYAASDQFQPRERLESAVADKILGDQ